MNYCLVVLLFAAAITTATARMMREITEEEGRDGSGLRNSALGQSENDAQSMRVAVTIENYSGFSWRSPSVYFVYGTSDDTLPLSVLDKTAFTYNARGTSGSPSGATGVICYYIPHEQETVCFLYSVPINRRYSSNLWNAMLYLGYKEASYHIYTDLQVFPRAGDDRWYDSNLGNGLGFRGYMSSSVTAKLKVRVEKI